MKTTSPQLAAPGAGLPFWQRIILRYVFFPKYSKKMSWEMSQKFFEKEGLKLLLIAKNISPEKITQRILVKPMVGVEDSSRYWSVSMAIEHLIIVGTQMLEGIIDMTHKRKPSREADVAAVKPFENHPMEIIIPKFERFMKDFLEKTTKDIGDKYSDEQFFHPWFGRLNARQWMALAAAHQQIHRKQAQAIVMGLDK